MKKVLILEDEVNIRSFVVINLKRAGYDVIEAGTGMEALEKLHYNPDIKVAILDVMLPDIDGFEVCRRIRANIESQPTLIELLNKIRAGNLIHQPAPFQFFIKGPVQ